MRHLLQTGSCGTFWPKVLCWLTGTPLTGSGPAQGHAKTVDWPPVSSSARPQRPARPGRPGHRTGANRPLRVLQLLEPSLGHGHAGRLRISGRMADVCAELDRLAAREALQG